MFSSKSFIVSGLTFRSFIHSEVSPYTGQNGHHQKNLQTINAGEGVEKKEPSYTVGGNVNCTATMENSMEVP